MKRATTILFSVLAAAAAGFLFLRITRRRQIRVRAAIADEGYETAPDILYPRRRRSSDEHYGPVLPEGL